METIAERIENSRSEALKRSDVKALEKIDNSISILDNHIKRIANLITPEAYVIFKQKAEKQGYTSRNAMEKFRLKLLDVKFAVQDKLKG